MASFSATNLVALSEDATNAGAVREADNSESKLSLECGHRPRADQIGGGLWHGNTCDLCSFAHHIFAMGPSSSSGPGGGPALNLHLL
ncbi:hypothetical protein E4U35_004271 [Claviceps purpurea]|nr:hypothetical protein E4U28_002003 [Claviceps purpurea]KAG6154212.1 hypothetical protein E4U37_002293 [Claviceps purpurea]KAG6182510.1 hypothetical protein E4U36_003274 [Claviceps purpurea]KAG6203456.1 hypothetical protein E4U35_004271 [Claviceps purpurea]KAG6210450.1 hypothetical protein E4U50_002660 [Claviceps purpurea]